MAAKSKRNKSSHSSHAAATNSQPKDDSLTTLSPSVVDVFSFLDPFSPGAPFPPVLDEAEWAKAPPIDVLDRLAPPVLFFTPEVSEEYVKRFCLRTSPEVVISFNGFPAREIPVMRRLTTMMAGILSKAAESAGKASMSSSRPRNPLFQHHLNSSVFTLFSSLSAAANESRQRRRLLTEMKRQQLKDKESTATTVTAADANEAKAAKAAKANAKDQPPSNSTDLLATEIQQLQMEIDQDNQRSSSRKGKNTASSKKKGKASRGEASQGSTAAAAATVAAATSDSNGGSQSQDNNNPHVPPPLPLPPLYNSENIPPPAFFAKDGQLQYGYSERLLRFWRSLTQEERVRLVRDEHAALTTAWMDYSAERAAASGWCLCAHCKHRRMTVNDLTDAIYWAYCEELAEYLKTGGNQPSSLYSPEIANSMDEASRAKRFLFRSLSVVGEQALLPRYNQFILRLEAFSTQVFATDPHRKTAAAAAAKANDNLRDEYISGFRQQVKKMMKERGLGAEKMKIEIGPSSHAKSKSGGPITSPVVTSATLQASKQFLLQAKQQQLQLQQQHDVSSSVHHNDNATEDDYDRWAQAEFEGMGPYSWKRDFLFDGEYLRKLANLSRGPQYIREQYGEEVDCLFGSDSETDDEHGSSSHDHESGGGCERYKGPRGAIQSEDDEDLIDAETDLPIDEAELTLPGGTAVPVLPAGESEGVAQWSEASRIECGRTVFLMFAAEMFQYRLSAAYLESLNRKRQMELLAEVEEEERCERERLEKEKAAAASKKAKKAAKKKNNSAKKTASAVTEAKASSTAAKRQTGKPAETGAESDNDADFETGPVADDSRINRAAEAAEAAEAEQVVAAAAEELVEAEPAELGEKVSYDAKETCLPSLSVQTSSSLLFDPSQPSIFDSITVTSPTAQKKDWVEPDLDFDPLSLVEQLSKEMNNHQFEQARTGPAGVMPPPGFPPGFKSSSSSLSTLAPRHLDLDERFEQGPDAAAAAVAADGFDAPPFMFINGSGVDNGNPICQPAFSSYHRYHHQQQQQHYQQHQMPYQQTQAYPQAYSPTSLPSRYNHNQYSPMVLPYPAYSHPVSPPPPLHTHLNAQHPPPPQPQPPSFPARPTGNGNASPPGLQQSPPQESRFASFFSNSIFGPPSFFKDQSQY